MWKSRKIIAFIALGLMPISVHAATQGVPFTATVTHVCAITVTQDGIIAINGAYTRLRSFGPGTPGRADVTASGSGFTLSVDAPSSFDSEPATDITPENFRAWHRTTGATNYTRTQNPRSINAGLNRVRIHMDARKTGGNIFEAGNYSATVVLRCE